jgi:hypothetical protein
VSAPAPLLCPDGGHHAISGSRPWVARIAGTATTTAPPPCPKRPVLARRPEVASTRAAAAPPAVALPVADRGSHAGAVSGEYPREHERRCRPGLAQRRAPRRSGDRSPSCEASADRCRETPARCRMRGQSSGWKACGGRSVSDVRLAPSSVLAQTRAQPDGQRGPCRRRGSMRTPATSDRALSHPVYRALRDRLRRYGVARPGGGPGPTRSSAWQAISPGTFTAALWPRPARISMSR